MGDETGAARLDAILEALSFERRERDARALEDLFRRFQRRVACETLTRPAGEPDAFDAERFFAEWVREERGLAAGERARAFRWLAQGLGFAISFAEGTCLRPWERDEERRSAGDGGSSSRLNGNAAHRAAVVTIEGRRILADAAFPMPVLLPLEPPAREISTGIGTLSVAPPDGGDEIRVTCDARGEVSDLLRLHPTPDASAFPFEEICRPLPEDGAQRPFALRVLDDRVLFWRVGRMTILDAWSRLEYALPASNRTVLEKLFALDLGGVVLPEEAREAETPATLSVFHETPVSADEARRLLARDPPPRSLVAGREVLVEEAGAGSRITIAVALASDLPPEGPTEAVRKTLVFHLVSELFELSRG